MFWTTSLGAAAMTKLYEPLTPDGLFGVTVRKISPDITLYHSDGGWAGRHDLSIGDARSTLRGATNIVAANSDGTQWAAGGQMGDLIFFPTLDDKNRVVKENYYKRAISGLCFSRDGGRVFSTAYENPSITIWEPGGQELGTLATDLENILDIRSVTQSNLLIYGLRNQKQFLVLWNMDERRKVSEIPITNVRFAGPHGLIALVKPLDDGWHRFSLHNLEPMESIKDLPEIPQDGVLSPNGNFLAWAIPGEELGVKIWDINHQVELPMLPTYEGWEGASRYVGFSHSDSHLWLVTHFKGNEHKNVHIWDLRKPGSRPTRH